MKIETVGLILICIGLVDLVFWVAWACWFFLGIQLFFVFLGVVALVTGANLVR